MQRANRDSTERQARTLFGWMAAQLTQRNPNASDAARAFVKAQTRRLLHGEISAVTHALGWLGTHHKLKGKRRATLTAAHLRILVQKRPPHDLRCISRAWLLDRLQCHRRGLPMRRQRPHGTFRHALGHPGARAMLDVRCLYLSGLWEEFIAFRIQRESLRLYPGSAANDPHFSQPLAV